jgi:hypothetical protein
VITDTRLGDHATGLELQIEELVDRRERARREGWPSQVRVLDGQITELQVELAETAEQVANTHYFSVTIHLPPAQ